MVFLELEVLTAAVFATVVLVLLFKFLVHVPMEAAEIVAPADHKLFPVSPFDGHNEADRVVTVDLQRC